MPENRVLIVDDDPELSGLVKHFLVGEGHSVSVVSSGEDAEAAARLQVPDLVILDVGLPGISGPEVCRRLKTFCPAPILFLTAASTQVDQIMGFSAGADDYVIKPFDPQVLMARVRVLLARPKAVAPQTIVIDSLCIDVAGQTVVFDGRYIELTRYEFDVVVILAQRLGRIVSKSELLRQVWGEWHDGDHVVEVTMSRLRNKLEHAGLTRSAISTHRSLGYRLQKISGPK